MDIMALIMEARNNRKQPGIVVTDDVSDDSAPSDYTADLPDSEGDNNQQSTRNQPSPEGNDEPEGTDYSADIPTVDDKDQPTGNNPPPEEGNQDTTPDQNEDNVTDYGADVPSPDDNNEEQGDNNQPEGSGSEGGEGDQPPADETGTDPESSGENGEGNDQDTPPGEETGVDNEQLAQARTKISTILLLRSFIRMYQEINRFMKKISESRKNSLLATVTYKQVRDNLDKLSTLVYKYIVISFDSSSYEINLYNYNYFFEIMNLNMEMIRKVKEVEEKSNKNKE